MGQEGFDHKTKQEGQRSNVGPATMCITSSRKKAHVGSRLSRDFFGCQFYIAGVWDEHSWRQTRVGGVRKQECGNVSSKKGLSRLGQGNFAKPHFPALSRFP